MPEATLFEAIAQLAKLTHKMSDADIRAKSPKVAVMELLFKHILSKKIRTYCEEILQDLQPIGGEFRRILLQYLTEEVEFKRWELVKYYSASVFISIPCLVTFFHYFRINSLFCF